MPMTSSPFSSSMPFTPVVSRPISRTSPWWNRMLMPSLVASTMSLFWSHTWTSISSSPFSMLMALMPLAAHVAVGREHRLLHRALPGGEDQALVVGELAHRHQRRDLLVRLDGDAVDDRLPSRRAARLRDLVHLEPVELPRVGEEQQVVVRAGDEEVLDPVVVLEVGAVEPAPAAPLPLVGGDRDPLDVAASGRW